MRHEDTRAFTLIEILIVVMLMAILTVVTIRGFHTLSINKPLESEVQHVVGELNRARSLTLASQNADQYGVHLESSRVTLFEGTSFVNGAASNTVATLSPTVTISSIALTGGGSDVVFQRLTGKTTQDGIIKLSAVSSSTVSKTITVYQSGVVETQ
jgi:prepilin-type N-terminal cleavage/methylation domain-containing protein